MNTNKEIEYLYTLYPGLKEYVFKINSLLEEEYGSLQSKLSVIQNIENKPILSLEIFPSILNLKGRKETFDEKIIDFWKFISQSRTEPAKFYLALAIYHT